MKKYLSLLLALLMAFSCAALADAGIVTSEGFPVVTEPITLTIMASQSAVQPDFNSIFRASQETGKAATKPTFREFCTATAERKQRIPVHTFRRGEHVVIGEADFEVLYTCADAKEKITNFNDNSAVLMLSCKGTRVLFPGDAASVAGKVLPEAPEKLKCDVVQVSHHGFNGAPEEVYRLTGAHTALCPPPLYEMERNAGRPTPTCSKTAKPSLRQTARRACLCPT